MTAINYEFKRRIMEGQPVMGTFLNTGSAISAELAAQAGLDWLMLDLEHGMGSWEQILQQLIAVSGHTIAPIVRLPFLRPEYFKRAFDMGSLGVMVPYVETAEQAAEAVQYTRYPPRGQRGVAKFNRGAEFGGRFEEWLERSHKATLVVPQIESRMALDNLDAIAATEGVDVLFVGPLDLSVNLGIPQQFDHPEFIAAKAAVVAAARKHGKIAGMLAFEPSQVPGLLDEGFSFLATGSDGGYLSAAYKNLASESDRIFKAARS